MENTSAVPLSESNTSGPDKHTIFVFALQGYFFTVFINLTVIAIVSLEKELHQPMYIFLCNLCANGLLGTISFYPKFLSDLHFGSPAISHGGCLLQTFAIFSYAFCEATSLTAMSFDRYVAICKPLHYHTTMTPAATRQLLAFVWMVPCGSAAVSVALIFRTASCEADAAAPYCKFKASACAENTANLVFNMMLTCLHVSMGLFVLYTYGKILATCRKSKRSQSRCIQTCLPHLISFCNYILVTLFEGFSSVFNRADVPQGFKSFTSVAFLVTPPVINPIMYGINLTPIRTRISKML